MPKYGMVIDLQKCVGCGACALACKIENNTPLRRDGQTFNWADFLYKSEGKYPNFKFMAIPVLCNHCDDAPCVKACPVTPKAMHKHSNGITAHNTERCIGCRACQDACPYSALNVEEEKVQYSVISFNEHDKDTHPFFKDKQEVYPGATASGAELAQKAGEIPPHRNIWYHSDMANVRPGGKVEKCMFCEHRVLSGLKPACVEACPAGARIFGDLSDPKSEVSQLLKKYKAFRLKNNKGEILKPNEKGTGPNVYYIRSFSKR
ncbi:MAG: 4Fe-4S dicluster domain-containing protein [Caldimicrobium sp.]